MKQLPPSEQSPWKLLGNVQHLESSDPRGWLGLRGNLSTSLGGVGQHFFMCLASIKLYGWHGLKEKKKKKELKGQLCCTLVIDYSVF